MKRVQSGLIFLLGVLVAASAAQSKNEERDLPEANPARPTVTNPATLTPVGYLQFENGTLGATDSPEFTTRYEWNEVIKLAVSHRVQVFVSVVPVVHYTTDEISGNGTGGASLGAQVVLMPGEGAKPTVAVSYSHPLFDGATPDLDFGSPQSSSLLYVSADVKGFHYDVNAVFNEVIESAVHRLQFGQTLSISHAIGKGFAVSAEIWRFTQPFLRSNAVGNLWALSYQPRKNLVLDAGFEKGLTSTSTHWEAFAGFTYVLPHRLW